MAAVLLDVADGIATVTLNRPDRLNAISPDLSAELHAALTTATRSPAVRAVVLTGAGDRAFCAGDDLREPMGGTAAEVRRQIEAIQDISRLILFGDKPVVAAVNGWAVGGGLEWVISCDLSVWAETARGFMPEVTLGLGVTGGVTSLLPRLVGWQRARALLFLGEKHSARQFLELGLAHAVVPADQVIPEAIKLADRLGRLPAASFGALKRALGVVHRDEIERAMAAETEALIPLFLDPVTQARVAEFGRTGGA